MVHVVLSHDDDNNNNIDTPAFCNAAFLINRIFAANLFPWLC